MRAAFGAIYGPSTCDRTHKFRMNGNLDVPGPRWNNPVSRLALGGWQFSGINAFITGSPASFGFATTNNADVTGRLRPLSLAIRFFRGAIIRSTNTSNWLLPTAGCGNAWRSGAWLSSKSRHRELGSLLIQECAHTRNGNSGFAGLRSAVSAEQIALLALPIADPF